MENGEEEGPVTFTRLEWFIIGICFGFCLCVAAVVIGGGG